jgi:hypothetical protein
MQGRSPPPSMPLGKGIEGHANGEGGHAAPVQESSGAGSGAEQAPSSQT